MKKKLLTGLTGVAAAVALAGVASTASAMDPPYNLCVFKGQTELNAGGGALSCWLTMAAKVDCATGDVEVVAGGSIPGDPNCSGLFLGGFPWTGSLPAIIAGGATITMGGPAPWNVMDAGGTQIAGTSVNGVSGGPLGTHACGTGSINIPSYIEVDGTFAWPGGTTFKTIGPKHLDNKGCSNIISH